MTTRRANDLDGATWTRYSISLWDDIRKSPEELSLKHPAMFPVQLVARLIQCFTTEADRVVLDPFVGTGATALAAEALGKTGIGFDVSPDYVSLAGAHETRARQRHVDPVTPRYGSRRAAYRTGRCQRP